MERIDDDNNGTRPSGRRQGMRIGAYLGLTAGAVIIPVGIFATIALDLLLSAERKAALRSVHETARATALAVDRELARADATLRVLGSSSALAEGRLADFHLQAQRAVAGHDSWIVLFDGNGQQLVNTFVPYGSPLPRRENPERGLEVMRSQSPRVTSVSRAPVSERPVVAFETPVPVAGGQRFVLSQAFPLEYFNRISSQPGVPPSWVIGIFDRDGVTVARSRAAEKFVGKQTVPDLVRAMRRAPEGMLRTRTMDGEAIYGAYTRSQASGWTIAVGVPEQEIEATARRAVMLAGLGLLAALACALAAGAYFGRRLARAIGAAADAARKLGRGGQPQCSSSGVAEVDALHAALAEAGELLRSERESRHQAESDRARLFESEQGARRMAESQNRTKDEFLAMLGHELRNPLGAITNAVTIMETVGLSEEGIDRARAVISRQSRHLNRIVDDLLDVSRVMSGKVFLDRSRIDLADAARNAVQALQAARRSGQHRIDIVATPTWIEADPTRVEQIIGNLLSNACKYTPGAGRILVRVGTADGKAVLSVQDPGIGIPARMLSSIFEVFVQAPAQLDRSQGGLGIGLALVRRLVTLHGGSVRAESPGPGQGSTFTVLLPLAQAPVGTGATQAGPVRAQEGRRVLLVEDNQDNRQTMAAVLEMFGHRVIQAGDGAEGLRLAQEQLPEVAVIDIGLPLLDGHALARRLRAQPPTAGMRLIALTGYGQAEDRQRALDAGFDQHLVKPVQAAQLLAALTQGRLAGDT